MTNKTAAQAAAAGGTDETVDRSGAVCIVGAGPAGLSAARMFAAYGIDYDQFERHTDVGGLWDIDNPGTPMYESAHFISSRDTSGFFGYPMPKSFGDYPTRLQILEYTRSFADAFGLREKITYSTAVADVRQDGEHWIVTPEGLAPRRYRAVVCATGTNWDPKLPQHPGQFNGEVRHSSTYRSPREFDGRRVLIVGLGNSGADIATDAAQSAKEAFISVRRGYHIIPKHILGRPTDSFDKGPAVPLWLLRLGIGAVNRVIIGDLTRWGLPKPDHKLLESHPLVNTQLVHHLQHGDIAVKADVVGYDGDAVLFADGSREDIDLVLFATGYNYAIPYVPSDYFTWSHGRPQQYLTAFTPGRRNLITLGYLEVNSSAYTLFDQISNMAAQYLLDQQVRPDRAARFDDLIATDRPDLSGGLDMVKSDRHTGYLDSHTYRKYTARLRKRMGWRELSPDLFAGLGASERRAVPASYSSVSRGDKTLQH